MYDTLRPELITATDRQRAQMKYDPTFVVEKSMFFQNQFPYLEVRRPFILGTREKKWKATLAHHFVELLHKKTEKLTRLYTQNIDGLQFQCDGIPREKIVCIHGTIGLVECENCGHSVDLGEFCDNVKSSIKDIYGLDKEAPTTSSEIKCVSCGQPTLKPATVLFGGSLPEEFFSLAQEDLPKLDLLIIAGTSLVVSPANSISYNVPDRTIRLIINNEPVGQELGIKYHDDGTNTRDVFVEGDCEEVFLNLMCLLGWHEDILGVRDVLPEASLKLVDEKRGMNDG